jgi:hypothetical protein
MRRFASPNASSRDLRSKVISLGCLLVLLAVAAGFVTVSTASAQTSAHGHWVYDPKSTATAGFIFDAPPVGFDPIKATDFELAQWGFPPRPDSSHAESYARWKKVVTSTRVAPRLTFTNTYHGPARGARVEASVANQTATTSENWSGYVISEATGTFANTEVDDFIGATWTVPAVAPAPGISCGSATYASSQWIGFDGWSSSDVLQAGTEADCGNADYAWYEWYPNAETQVSLPVAPGDEIHAYLYYYSSSPYGRALLVNEVAQQYVSVGFNPPSGTTYEGNSAEWIMERPTVNGSLADLPNYGSIFFSGADAVVDAVYYYPSSVPAGTIYAVTMTCNPWVPASACVEFLDEYPTISIPDPVIGQDTFEVYAHGPADPVFTQ